MSAHGIEDLSLICSLPSFTVISPSDSLETLQAVKTAARTEGPFYIRLSRAATPVVHDEDYKFNLGQAERIREGQDVTILATGVMVSVSLDAADLLASEGVECPGAKYPHH